MRKNGSDRERERERRRVVQTTNPKIITTPKHANILFHRHAVKAFPITAGPECICRSWGDALDKDGEKSLQVTSQHEERL